MKKKIFYVFAIVSFAVGSLLSSYKLGYLRFNYPAPSEFPVMGIDVSHHQSVIAWKRVAEDGVNFAYIKATEGGDYKDPEFLRNWAETSRIGLPRGAYHFFSFCKNGHEQAKNFLGVVPADSNALPAVVDFEFVGNCKERPSKELLLKELSNFINDVEAAHKKTVLIYTTHEAYNKYLRGSNFDNKIWIRNIFKKPLLPDNKQLIFWQYADNGRIAGITGPVDLNVYYGQQERFLNFIQK